MAKKMRLIVQRPDPVTGKGVRIDLEIEKDSGNPIRILMGGKYTYENWKSLSALCDKARAMIDHPDSIKETDTY
jgi:hypothetical protein